MLAALRPFGYTAEAILPFAVGILAFFFTAVLVLTAIEFIKTLLK